MNDEFHNLNDRIRVTAERYGRDPASIDLLAVSKRQSTTAIGNLAGCGQIRFGENYLTEAEDKIAALTKLNIEWHFIGKLQSNKTRSVAALFEWVHSLDRVKIAARLNSQRPLDKDPLNVCVEVNISGEPSKSGIEPAELPSFLRELQGLDRLRVRGLMALPAPFNDFVQQRAAFRQLADLMGDLKDPSLDTLSMGTTNDFEAAIAEGATIIRIGTALFGSRR